MQLALEAAGCSAVCACCRLGEVAAVPSKTKGLGRAGRRGGLCDECESAARAGRCRRGSPECCSVRRRGRQASQGEAARVGEAEQSGEAMRRRGEEGGTRGAGEELKGGWLG